MEGHPVGGLGVELYGAARMAEALASHRWPHMVMKPRPHGGGVDADGDVEDDAERPPAVPEAAASHPVATQTEFGGTPTVHADGARGHFGSLMAPRSHPCTSTVCPAFESAYTRMGGGGDDDEDEAIEGFERMLELVQGFRGRRTLRRLDRGSA